MHFPLPSFRRYLPVVALAVALVVLGLHTYGLHRQLATPDPTGVWTMHWRGQEAPVRFGMDGSYTCTWRGRLWAGQWAMDSGTLLVREWPAGQPGRTRYWRVTFQRGRRAGSLHSGGRFELYPR
jgi:hypothetical protein